MATPPVNEEILQRVRVKTTSISLHLELLFQFKENVPRREKKLQPVSPSMEMLLAAVLPLLPGFGGRR